MGLSLTVSTELKFMWIVDIGSSFKYALSRSDKLASETFLMKMLSPQFRWDCSKERSVSTELNLFA